MITEGEGGARNVPVVEYPEGGMSGSGVCVCVCVPINEPSDVDAVASTR